MDYRVKPYIKQRFLIEANSKTLDSSTPTNCNSETRLSCRSFFPCDRDLQAHQLKQVERPNPIRELAGATRGRFGVILVFLQVLFFNICIADCQLIARPKVASQTTQISEYVRKVYQDNEGNYWFGTNDDGVAFYDGKSLRYFTPKDGLAGRAIRGMIQDQTGAMWFATDGGVSRYSNGLFESYTTDDGLSDNDAWSILLGREGTILVGTKGGVCYWKDTKFIPFDLPEPKIKNPTSLFSTKLVWSMETDRAGNIWFGTDGAGVCRFNGKDLSVFTEDDGLPSNQVSNIVQDQRGLIWFGFITGGICSYDGTVFRRYGQGEGLPDGWEWTLHSNRAGEVLVSVLGYGIYRFADHRFQVIDLNNQGLPTQVQSLLEDRAGILWLGCSGGLFRLEDDKLVNVTKDGPWPDNRHPSSSSSAHLKHFAQLVSDSWTVTAGTGTKMFHTWKWGQGKNSIERWTDGQSAQGTPWRELIVYYWHPLEKRVRLLGISPFASGVSHGTIEFDGVTAVANSKLHQSSGTRDIQTRWSFDGVDRYSEGLFEKNASGKVFELVSFWHIREPKTSDVQTEIDQASADVLEELSGLGFLLGKPWKGCLIERPDASIRMTVEWIPTTKFLFGKILRDSNSGDVGEWTNFYLYHDTGTKSLRCLALGPGEMVYEGELKFQKEGQIQIELRSTWSTGVKSIHVSSEVTADNQLTIQVADATGDPQLLTFSRER